MKYVAHETDGVVFAIGVADDMDGVYPGDGCVVLDSLTEVEAQWPGLNIQEVLNEYSQA